MVRYIISTPLAHLRLVLAGATWRDRLLACAGVFVGLSAIAALAPILGSVTDGLPLLIAPIGASAVLVFAVPASPLAQPWAVVGGNLISMNAGITAAALVADPMLAPATAVAVAILLMSAGRCLHPPGGALALMMALGAPAAASTGQVLAVALGSALLVSTAWVFHRVSGHSYPHRAQVADTARALEAEGLHPADVEQAIGDLGDTFDIAREDLELLLARAEHHADLRRAAAAKAPRLVRRAA